MEDPFAAARAALVAHCHAGHGLEVPPLAGLGYVAAEHATRHAGRGAASHVHPPLDGDELGLLVEALGMLAVRYLDRPAKRDAAAALATRLQVEHVALRQVLVGRRP